MNASGIMSEYIVTQNRFGNHHANGSLLLHTSREFHRFQGMFGDLSQAKGYMRVSTCMFRVTQIFLSYGFLEVFQYLWCQSRPLTVEAYQCPVPKSREKSTPPSHRQRNGWHSYHGFRTWLVAVDFWMSEVSIYSAPETPTYTLCCCYWHLACTYHEPVSVRTYLVSPPPRYLFLSTGEVVVARDI